MNKESRELNVQTYSWSYCFNCDKTPGLLWLYDYSANEVRFLEFAVTCLALEFKMGNLYLWECRLGRLSEGFGENETFSLMDLFLD